MTTSVKNAENLTVSRKKAKSSYNFYGYLSQTYMAILPTTLGRDGHIAVLFKKNNLRLSFVLF